MVLDYSQYQEWYRESYTKEIAGLFSPEPESEEEWDILLEKLPRGALTVMATQAGQLEEFLKYQLTAPFRFTSEDIKNLGFFKDRHVLWKNLAEYFGPLLINIGVELEMKRRVQYEKTVGGTLLELLYTPGDVRVTDDICGSVQKSGLAWASHVVKQKGKNLGRFVEISALGDHLLFGETGGGMIRYDGDVGETFRMDSVRWKEFFALYQCLSFWPSSLALEFMDYIIGDRA